MPIYEYTCSECGKSFEALLLTAESFKSLKCPNCDSKKISKNLSVFSPSVAATSSAIPRCESSGGCMTPNLPGCKSGMCGLH